MLVLLRYLFLQLCRFSAAGNDSLTTRYGDRRLKSAKARSRGKLGTDWQRALWGFQVGADVTAGKKATARVLRITADSEGGSPEAVIGSASTAAFSV
jgi:hypothetical protein